MIGINDIYWVEMIALAGRIAGRVEDASGPDAQFEAHEGFVAARGAMRHAETMAGWWTRQAAELAALVVELGIESHQPSNELMAILDEYRYVAQNGATKEKFNRLRLEMEMIEKVE